MSNILPKCQKCGAEVDSDSSDPCPVCLLQFAAEPTNVLGESLDLEAIRNAFPQLEILEPIGRGGMGSVFKARQPKLDRFVALKILAADLETRPSFAERFAQEGKLLARLNHPNIVAVYDFGQSDGFYYLILEYVDGVNLRQALREERFTPEQAIAIVPKICDALQYAHDEGVLHRDIKPENILLDTKGRIKIADFGIGKFKDQRAQTQRAGSGAVLRATSGLNGQRDGNGETSELNGQNALHGSCADANLHGSCADANQPGSFAEYRSTSGSLSGSLEKLTQTGQILGTPSYMAPEQLNDPNRVDHRADIYSLGVVFYELLTGELPRGRFPLPSEKTPVGADIDSIVLKAMHTEREKRQQSAEEMKSEITAASVKPSKPSKKPGIGYQIGAEVRTWPTWVTILVVCVTVLLIAWAPLVVFLLILACIASAILDLKKWITTLVWGEKKQPQTESSESLPPKEPRCNLAVWGFWLVVLSWFLPIVTFAALHNLIYIPQQIKNSAEYNQKMQQFRQEGHPVDIFGQIDGEFPNRIRQEYNAKYSRLRLTVLLPPTALLLLFGIPGTILGWRHLVLVRGMPEKRGWVRAMLSALCWPLFLTCLGIIALSYLEQQTLLVVLACIAGIVGVVGVTYRWLNVK